MAEPSPLYSFWRWMFRLGIWLTMRLDVRGLDRTPMEGGLLITPNHTSLWEGPIVFALTPRKRISALAKREWKGSTIGKLIIDHLNPVYVSRGEIDRHALTEMIRRLKAGEAFGLAPEGTRSPDGKLQEGKEGAAYLAARTGAQILPMAVWGHANLIADLKRFHRPVVHVRAGEPFRLEDDPTLDRRENLERHTERIMSEIARLMPPELRGHYADKVLGPPEW